MLFAPSVVRETSFEKTARFSNNFDKTNAAISSPDDASHTAMKRGNCATLVSKTKRTVHDMMCSCPKSAV